MKSTKAIYEEVMMEAKTKSILKKPEKVGEVKAFQGKEELDDVYRVMIGPSGDSDTLWIEYDESSRTPGWPLKSILFGDKYGTGKPTGDMLYIDYGHKWFVTGLAPILKKLRKRFKGKLEETNNTAK